MAEKSAINQFELLRSKLRITRYYQARTLTDQELHQITGEVDSALKNGFPKLYFTKPLEEAYELETGESRARYLIIGGKVALITNDAFLYTDYTMLPDVFILALIIRLLIVTPIAFILIFFLYRGLSPVIRESVEAAVTLLAGTTIIYLAANSQSPYAVYYNNGLMLVILFGNIVIRLRFWYAVAASMATLFLFGIFFPRPPENLALLHFDAFIVLFSGIAFTLFANYNLEKDERRNYLLGLRERILRASLTSSNQRLAELSHIDPLTGIPNRRELNEYLQRLVQAPHNLVLSVVMLDIDHFKLYNDLYGHLAGDECLRQIAMILRRELRSDMDMIARFGLKIQEQRQHQNP